jgi:large subunit ribosomal protein L23
MGLLDRFQKKKGGPTEQDVAPKKATTKKAASKKEEAAPQAGLKATQGNALSSALILKPHVSEKAARLADAGTYVFDVATHTEKIAIKKAIEGLYKVNVMSVRTIRHDGKPIYRGRRPGARNAWKKALVTLKPGQKIDIYEGV